MPILPYSVQVYPQVSQRPEFKLPKSFRTHDVCRFFREVHSKHAHVASHAKTWLEERGFHPRIAPSIMYYLWAHEVPGANDLIGNLSYDCLHCFFIGLLAYFLDAVILAIHNSCLTTEQGNEAVKRFEAFLASFPAHDTGYRLFRAFPGAFVRRAINSGNDLFFLLLLFIPAIGLGPQVIQDAAKRKVVLSALEAASILAFLLRAKVLSPSARWAAYKSARRFLELLKHDMFRTRQKSEWAIFKHHMLMHIINWLSSGRAAPGYSNTSTLEAALGMYISRLAAKASSHHDLQRDIMTNYTNLVTTDLLVSAGGAAADALKDAYERPRRNQQTLNAAAGRCKEAFVKPCVQVPRKKGEVGMPSVDVLHAVEHDWHSAAPLLGAAPGASDTLIARSTWYGYARVARPEWHFNAPVRIGATVALSKRGPVPDPVEWCDDPARERIGRVAGFFYLNPPMPGSPSDGLPAQVVLGQGPVVAPLLRERMFVVIWPFRGQTEADATRVSDHGLNFFSVRRPAVRVEVGDGGALRLPVMVYHISSLRYAVRVFPLEWPRLTLTRRAGYGATPREQDNAFRAETAACAGLETPALIFWPPLRGTFVPNAAVPEQPDGALPVEEEDEADIEANITDAAAGDDEDAAGELGGGLNLMALFASAGAADGGEIIT